jgi:hypothetical protein
VHSTPSKDRNANGKRAMVPGAGPKTRRKDHLKRARSALENWRVNTYLREYISTSLTYEVLLPDVYLRSLASHRTKNLDELGVLIPGWAFFDEHGEDVLLVLLRVDNAVREEREREKAANKLARRQETLQRQADRKAERVANPKPAKKRGRPPKAREPLASTSTNTVRFWLACLAFADFSFAPSAGNLDHRSSATCCVPDTQYGVHPSDTADTHSTSPWLSLPSGYATDSAPTIIFPAGTTFTTCLSILLPSIPLPQSPYTSVWL